MGSKINPQHLRKTLLASIILTLSQTTYHASASSSPGLRKTLETTSAYPIETVADQVVTLPGLSSVPDFNIFSGYLSIDEDNDSNIFYMFVEAETNPETAPVIWWTNGGPGCSGLLAYGTENGPFKFVADGVLEPNPYSWNKMANMLYVEQPAGVGFSHTSYKGLVTDEMAANDNYKTIKAFLNKFSNLKTNDFYISSESYGGHYIPQLTKTILEKDTEKEINFKGFAVGNPYVDPFTNVVTMYEAYYSHGLLPKPLYDEWHNSCSLKRNYILNKFKCQRLQLKLMHTPGNGINPYALDWPVCTGDETKAVPSYIFQRLQLLKYIHPTNLQSSELGQPTPDDYQPCGEDYLTTYLNREDVQTAIHAKGLRWVMCSNTVNYSYEDVGTSQIDLYKSLVTDLGANANLNMLVFSGDDDSICSLSGTQSWIYDLGVKPIEESNWNVWTVDEQTAGYVTKFDMEHGGSFTLVTVRGAGHEVPTYKPKEAYVLLENFLSGEW